MSSWTASTRASASVALVADDELDALVEEGHLAQARGDRLEVVVGGLEDVLRGVPGHRGAGALAGLHRADLLEVGVGDAELEGLAPQVAAVLDLGDEAGGQRVDDRDADAVQTTGDLVAAAAELAAGVEHRQRHRERRHLLAGGGVGGDAAPVVLDPHAAVGLQGQHDPVADAGQRLVDAVVHDLPDQVVQAALTGRADVHAGALAHRLEALEDGDRGGVVLEVLVDRVGVALRVRSAPRASRPQREEVSARASRGSDLRGSRRSLRSRHSLLLIAREGRST